MVIFAGRGSAKVSEWLILQVGAAI